MTSPKSAEHRWNKTQIRTARKVQLAPLLARRGLRLQPLRDDNICVVDHDDLLIKESFWRWPSKNIQGNAIDFFMKVEGMSFHETMTVLTQQQDKEL